ncbi:DUF1800 domain-containing protein [Frigoriglobus tundricola]|uniref:DUF1800 domain-containing protein n=1 Tax=Frigoriglobus tundricola TaxID=2774151 RepID=A0A6M5Z2W6_9BACT|nr:DUF1800 domain-containing protein [Frigoriglobus tundricola]QJW99890.1 hypothetical protein FTUN_7513 [Frigoriglobus tundricola]
MALKYWDVYEPDARAPWDLRRVVHLHRRAAFAAPWGTLQSDLKAGPEASVKRLLDGTRDAHSPADFAATAGVLADAAATAGDINRLKAAWFYRMLFGPDPVGERLTLAWHDHFATGYAKVRNVQSMRRQNELFRSHARARFAPLLNALVRDPALLEYLDAPANRKGHPNENLARELMELFTLGTGHYTEADVKEAARCLTGWGVEEGTFAESAPRHDSGAKTVLGKTGKWTGADLVDLLLKQPSTAERLVAKLVKTFFGEGACPPDAAKELAAGLRDHELDIGWAVLTVLRSRLFFADANLRTRVTAPPEFVAGAARALGLFDPAPSTLALADWSARMGQDLFDPPNVGGWPGGRAWVTSRALIARANYAAALVDGPNAGRSVAYEPNTAAKAAGFGTARTDVLVYHSRLLFGTDPPAALTGRLGKLDGRPLVTALLSSPEAQLG